MSDRPLESWIRDALYEQPGQLLDLLGLEEPPNTYWRWKEFPVESGRIDLLLAWDGHVVVVEVKRETADENAVSQALRYSGAIINRGYETHTIIVARDFTNGARYAALAASIHLLRAMPSVDLDHDMVTLPFNKDLYAELDEIACPNEYCRVRTDLPGPVIGPRESGPSSDDLAALVRRDANGPEGPSADLIGAGRGSGDED